jgi:hypothetical protein
MIKVVSEEGGVRVQIEGNPKEVFTEMCILFLNLRKYHKDFYLSALKFARETVQKESEEDA